MKKLKSMTIALLLSTSLVRCMNITDIIEPAGFVANIGSFGGTFVGAAVNGASNIVSGAYYCHNVCWNYDLCKLINVTSRDISNGYGPELVVMVGSGLQKVGRMAEFLGDALIAERIINKKQNMEKKVLQENQMADQNEDDFEIE